MTVPEGALTAAGKNSQGFRGALASRDFSLLFTGQLGSEVGNGLIQLALPFLVLQLTGSALQLGVAYFFQFLPMLLFGLVGGVLVDRWDRRLTIVVVDAIRALGFLSVGAIYYLDSLSVEYLYAVIFLEASLANFFNPARAALMPNLVGSDSLRAANSLSEVARHIGFLIAPPVGGLLSQLLGPAALFLVNGVTFFGSAMTISLIRWRPATRVVAPSDGWRHSFGTMLRQTTEGLAVIRRAKILQVSLLLGFALNLTIAPIQVLMPLFVLDVKHQEESYFALLVAGLLLGLITGSLTAPVTSRVLGLGRMAIGAVLLLGILISVSAWPPTIWPPLIAMTLAGVCIGSLNVVQTTMLQSATSDEERGRVSAAYYTFTLGVRPFGALAVGALASAVDIRIMFVVLGGLAICVGIMLARMREVREAR